MPCCRTSAVHGARIHDDDLVDETGPLGQRPYPRHDLADRRLLVERRQHHADPAGALAV
jgi:hypothetical protein